MNRPNVVLIHGHDLGRLLDCYGAGVPSPHLDALAAHSVVYDRAFATAPLCTPARGSLFTGRSPHVHGLMGLAHQGWRYRQSVTTLPELLARQGYRTALVGLQHEHPDPLVLGFDEVLGTGFLPRALPVAEEARGWLAAPGRRHHLVSHLDVMPTLLEAAGAGPDPGGEGRSLAADLRGEPPAPDGRMLFFEKTFHDGYDPIRAVRTDRFKYIRNFADGPELLLSKDLEESPTRRGMDGAHLRPRPPVELYDLHHDPQERHNLATDPAHAPTRTALDQALAEWMSATRDPLLAGEIPAPPAPSRLVDAQPDLR